MPYDTKTQFAEPRHIDDGETHEAIRRMETGIAVSPVLSHLGLLVHKRGKHFHLKYEAHGESITMARVTPMAGTPSYALENKVNDCWQIYGEGTPTRLIKVLSNDAIGTFHGLGLLDQTMRNVGDVVPEVSEPTPHTFCYTTTGFACSLQEALYYLFDVPMEVIMEPREFYVAHAKPNILDIGRGGLRLLVRFLDSRNSKIVGHVLYAKRQGEWRAVTLSDDDGQTLESAEAYLKTIR